MLASAVAVFAPNVAVLVAARLFQGLGGAAGMVIGRAVISDLSTGKAAARAFSLMMIVGGVAPVVAPLLGGLLVGPIGWRGLLAIVLGLSVAMLVAVLAVVRETHLRARRDMLRAERVASGSPLRALRSRTFIGYTAVFAFGFAVMMAYISASPFLYQNMLGLDTVAYGLLFGLNALALVVVSALSPKLTATRSVESVLTLGIALVTASAVASPCSSSSERRLSGSRCRCSPPSGRWAWCSETPPPWRSAPSPRSPEAPRPCSEHCSSVSPRWSRRW